MLCLRKELRLRRHNKHIQRVQSVTSVVLVCCGVAPGGVQFLGGHNALHDVADIAALLLVIRAAGRYYWWR